MNAREDPSEGITFRCRVLKIEIAVLAFLAAAAATAGAGRGSVSLIHFDIGILFFLLLRGQDRGIDGSLNLLLHFLLLLLGKRKTANVIATIIGNKRKIQDRKKQRTQNKYW